jgi:hypothetical protein
MIHLLGPKVIGSVIHPHMISASGARRRVRGPTQFRWSGSGIRLYVSCGWSWSCHSSGYQTPAMGDGFSSSGAKEPYEVSTSGHWEDS